MVEVHVRLNAGDILKPLYEIEFRIDAYTRCAMAHRPAAEIIRGAL